MAFSYNSHLIKHIWKHTGEKLYKCSECDKAFSYNSHLIRHIQTHTGEKLYKCSECNKSFSNNINLIKHIQTHTREKSCDNAFSDNSSLSKHVKIYVGFAGDNPYRCSHYDKASLQKGKLNAYKEFIFDESTAIFASKIITAPVSNCTTDFQ